MMVKIRFGKFIAKILFWAFIAEFFGGMAILLANFFWRFLPQAAFAIVALIIMAQLAPLLVIATLVKVAMGRGAGRAAQKISELD
jgi:hypothetical protein